MLSNLNDEDMLSYDQIAFCDIFDSLEELNILVPENLGTRLLEYFPDEISSSPSDSKIKMGSIYKMWKKVCLIWKD